MSVSPVHHLKVNVEELADAMQHADGHIMEEQTAYLDLKTGEIVWVFDSDEDYASTTNADAAENAAMRARAENEPDGFVEIPPAYSIDPRDLLCEFLRSNWTDDESLRREAEDAYRGAVGRWRRAISHDRRILHAWHAYEAEAYQRAAVEFLASCGVQPVT